MSLQMRMLYPAIQAPRYLTKTDICLELCQGATALTEPYSQGMNAKWTKLPGLFDSVSGAPVVPMKWHCRK